MVRVWLKYLRTVLKNPFHITPGNNQLQERENEDEIDAAITIPSNSLASSPYSSVLTSGYQFTPPQIVRCCNGFVGMMSEHVEVRKFLRLFTLLIFQSPVEMTSTDLDHCYVALRGMNRNYSEVEQLFQVLEQKRVKKE